MFPVDEVAMIAKCDVVVAGSGSAGNCAARRRPVRQFGVANLESVPNIGGTATSGITLGDDQRLQGPTAFAGNPIEDHEVLSARDSLDGDLPREFDFSYDVDKCRLIVTRMLREADVAARELPAKREPVEEVRDVLRDRGVL